jgi:Ca2+-binding RTX toxin-like protein
MTMGPTTYSFSVSFISGIQRWPPTAPALDDMIGGTDDGEVLIGTSGADMIRARGGADTIFGGLGSDRIDPGGGHDTIAFTSALDSTSLNYDRMADFNAEKDVFQVPNAVTAMDAPIIGGPLRTSNFDADLANATDDGALDAHHAVAFIPQTGDHAFETFLIVDQNGEAGYQAGEDLVLHLEELEQLLGLTAANFVVG